MPNELRALTRDVVDDVRGACDKSGRPTTEAEVRRVLEALDAAEVDRVRRVARAGVSSGPVSPDALVDIARGTPAPVAAARELGGYYAMKAERDALAQIARAREPEPEPLDDEDADDAEPSDEEEADEPEADVFESEQSEDERPAPPAALPPATRRRRAVVDPKVSEEESRKLVTLFAYHRDAVRVAQELGLGMMELSERIESLGLKRRIHRLLEMSTDIDNFSPELMHLSREPANPTPVLRKRGDVTTKSGAPLDEAQARSADTDAGPAAETTPVNSHGTRVYRREGTRTTPAAATPEPGIAGRREYVRETRRRGKAAPRPATPAPRPEPVAVPAVPSKRPFSELQGPGGAKILEKLLADEKANPRVLAARLGERFAGAGDRALSEGDLRMLLQHHGLAETFREREIANTRFLIGFHQGARNKLANALQMTPAELATYLGKIGLADDLERTRNERSRLELGRRKIHDRIVQVLTRAPYLDDIGVLAVIDREVREHLEQLFAARKGHDTASTLEHIREELGLEANALAKLMRRYEIVA